VLADRFRRRLPGSRPGSSTGQSALLVAVPEAEALVQSIRGGSGSHDGLPAHVTVLFPFLAPASVSADVLDRLRETFRRHLPFAFSLTGVDTFPGVVWLAPEPGGPFLALTESVVRAWPDLVPYGDPTLRGVAHLTVGRGRLRRSWRSLIEAAVPIEARATEVLLMTEEGAGSWTVRARFPLGVG
jgi:2'-5' RNA ligase